MDQNKTWHEVGLGTSHIVLDGDPAAPPAKGHSPLPPIFRPMSIVAKRSPISATAELLYKTVMQKLDQQITINVRTTIKVEIKKSKYRRRI